MADDGENNEVDDITNEEGNAAENQALDGKGQTTAGRVSCKARLPG